MVIIQSCLQPNVCSVLVLLSDVQCQAGGAGSSRGMAARKGTAPRSVVDLCWSPPLTSSCTLHYLRNQWQLFQTQVTLALVTVTFVGECTESDVFLISLA